MNSGEDSAFPIISSSSSASHEYEGSVSMSPDSSWKIIAEVPEWSKLSRRRGFFFFSFVLFLIFSLSYFFIFHFFIFSVCRVSALCPVRLFVLDTCDGLCAHHTTVYDYD